jgi:hypothetical protein
VMGLEPHQGFIVVPTIVVRALCGQSSGRTSSPRAGQREAPGLLPRGLPKQAFAGTGWTRPITRGSGVCRVFADRRLGGTQNTVGKD